MEAITGLTTIQEIAADHAIHPIQVSQWKRQLLDDASELSPGVSKARTRRKARPSRPSCSSSTALQKPDG